MLTGYQVETIAGYTEHGEILCLECAADEYTKALSRYELDEEQSQRAYAGYYEGEDDHVEDDCECCPGVDCERCGAELVEPYYDPECIKLRKEAEDDE